LATQTEREGDPDLYKIVVREKLGILVRRTKNYIPVTRYPRTREEDNIVSMSYRITSIPKVLVLPTPLPKVSTYFKEIEKCGSARGWL
jgi:hypothetical protein